MLNWQSFGHCCLDHGGTYAREELESSLSTWNVTENKAKQSCHLNDGRDGSEYGRLQAEGEVQSGKKGGKVHCGEYYSLRRKQVLQVIDRTPQE